MRCKEIMKSLYKQFWVEMRKFSKRCAKRRKGASLAELLLYIVVAGILGAAVIYGAGTAPNKANYHKAQEELRSLSNAIQQATIFSPNILRLQPTAGSTACADFVKAVNDQLDSQFQFTVCKEATESGLIAETSHKDPWGTPYGLYVFFNDPSTSKKYCDKDGNALSASDSCVVIAITSSGRNAQGLQAGVGSANLDGDSRIVSAKEALINTDGVDDVGIICRVKNGDFATQMFGVESAGLGDLKGVQWIIGWEGENNNGGQAYDFVANVKMNVKMAGSLDQFPDAKSVKEAMAANTSTNSYMPGVIGAWTAS